MRPGDDCGGSLDAGRADAVSVGRVCSDTLGNGKTDEGAYRGGIAQEVHRAGPRHYAKVMAPADKMWRMAGMK